MGQRLANMQAAAEAFIANPTTANEQAVRDTTAQYGGLSMRQIDDRVRMLRSSVSKVPVDQQCTRCGGTGRYQHYGVCFRCDGSGREA